MSSNQRFWDLVDAYEIPAGQLSQICNAPIKVLCDWIDGQPPDSAIAALEKHIGIKHGD